MTLRPCIECGTPTDSSRCPAHTLTQPTKPADRQPTRVGYNWAWRKLSTKARRIQPWCSDCGAICDLTTDHSPQAWQRHARGLPVRLVDVDVVCRSCNAKRGAIRDLSRSVTMGGETPLAKGSRARAVGKMSVTDQSRTSGGDAA